MTVKIKGRRGLMLHARLAYPGVLGGGLPVPPPGAMFLTDDNGVFLTDDEGRYLVGENA